MYDRRQFIGTIPTSALAVSAWAVSRSVSAQETSSARLATDSSSDTATQPGAGLIASPPVVQHPRRDGFGVSIAVSGLATAWVEYGFAPSDLRFTAVASHHGLVAADDRALHVRVRHPEPLPVDRPVYYRVQVQPLRYLNAYKLERGVPQATATHPLRLPDEHATRIRLVSINDTHENIETIRTLHASIERYEPDLLIWNGDTCNDFDESDSPAQIMLNPGRDLALAWASARPLVFSNGNHDVRGRRVREAADCLVGCPESSELPYNQALRLGPIALVTLDTGEDKPDAHPVFAGTAAYEPYRAAQATWLGQALAQPEIASAPFKIAVCHIPLRGLAGSNDGTTLEGFASYSGFGSRLWLPTLISNQVQAILSGHTHRHRIDAPTQDAPLHQFVGGGPQPGRATLTIIDADATGASAKLHIRIVDLDGQTLAEHRWE